MVPKGEMPRHMQLYCDRYLTNRVVPGNRITVMGIYSIRKSGIKPAKVRQPCSRIIITLGVAPGQRASSLPWCVFLQHSRDKASSAGLRRPYLRVVGFEVESEGPGRASGAPLTPAEEEELRRLAGRPDLYETVAKSIAPSIYGSSGKCVESCFLCLRL